MESAVRSESKIDMQTQKLSREIITAAIQGFEAQKQQIDSQIAELRSVLEGGAIERSTDSGAAKPKRKFSAEALRRMREAQQRRWARVRGEAVPQSPAKQGAKPKRRLSAAGRRAIAEAARRRWAAHRAAAQKAQSPAAKKAARKKSAGTKAAAKKSTAKRPAARKSAAAGAPAAESATQ